jgi:hypothetical protein
MMAMAIAEKANSRGELAPHPSDSRHFHGELVLLGGDQGE